MKKQIHFGNKSSKSNLDFKKLNELQERLQGTSENSNPVTDPFKFLGEFDSYDELNATLDTLTYSLGYQKGYGYFRARVEDRAIDVKNILMSSDLNVVGQVVQGMLSLDGNKKLSPAYSTYRIYFRKHQNDVWGEWKEYAGGTSSGGSSSGGDVDLSDYATIEELDEATNYLAQYINTVETKIPDVRINNESIVNESKIVNLEEHFKTINGNSILGSGDIEITGSGSVDLSDYVKKTDEGVQHILGGLVVGSDEAPSAAQKGRIMLTGVENPLIGVQSGTTPYYVQAHENKMYVGPVRGKAMMLDSSGNVTMSAALSVTGDISEGGETLSKKYTTKGELTTTELYFVDYVKDKVKDRVKAIIVNGGDPITPNSEGVLDLGYIEGGSSGDGDGGEVAVADVTVDGASVVVNKVAQIALASTTKKGVVQLSDRYDSNSSDYAASSSAVYGVYNLLGDKVDKVEGKDLSTNDYTDDDKEKLDSIEESANNYTHPSEGEMAAGSYAAYNPSSFFDENSDVLQIPTLTVNKYGHVTSAGVNYVELPKFKTINNQTVVGEGNITIAGGDGGSVDLSDYVKEVKINNAAQTPDEDGVVALGITINGNSGTVSGSDSATLMFNNITQAIKIDSDATPIYCGIDGTLHLNGVLNKISEYTNVAYADFDSLDNDDIGAFELIQKNKTLQESIHILDSNVARLSKVVKIIDDDVDTGFVNIANTYLSKDGFKGVKLNDVPVGIGTDGYIPLTITGDGDTNIDTSNFITRTEFEETESNLIDHIEEVETKIPDVRINNESIVNESKIVNLDGHFKTINGNSILVSGNDDSLKCVEKVLIDGDIHLNPEDGVLDLRGLLGDSSSGSGSVDLSDYVKKTDEGVQHILGGLVVGSDETPSAMQDEKHVGRIMLTGVENPLIGLLDNSDSAVPFYLQAYENELYVGQTRGKAIKINSSGNVTVQKALAVTNTISEGGTALSEKYQAKLVSGTNIKTINNQSILGSGNIVANAYPLVSHGTSDTTFTLTPNTFHVWGTVSSLTLTFGSETEGVANEYLFQFSCSSSVATTLSLPSSVMWADGETPTIEVMKTYQVSILNNCATIQSFG